MIIRGLKIHEYHRIQMARAILKIGRKNDLSMDRQHRKHPVMSRVEIGVAVSLSNNLPVEND
jgi:hypothetical protein